MKPDEDDVRRKMLAMQLATQLPADRNEAIKTVKLVEELVENWLFERRERRDELKVVPLARHGEAGHD